VTAGSFNCPACTVSEDCGDACQGWTGWFDSIPAGTLWLDDEWWPRCQCCGRQGQLMYVLEKVET
jgi:hypothetical protein